MAHFYTAMNYFLTRDFEAGLAAAAAAGAVGKDIGDPRLQTYAGFTASWIEVDRGRSAAAIALARRSLEQAPDRVSRAYSSLILGHALLEAGQHEEASERLAAIISEFEAFAFPQWLGLSLILLGEARRRGGAVDEAARLVARGKEVATRANYRYAMDLAARLTRS
jgi:tetratricopeptide (TPR) repeat protein